MSQDNELSGQRGSDFAVHYDYEKNVYVGKFTNPAGNTSEMTGEWDTSRNRMTWSSTDPDGNVMKARWEFISKDQMKWSAKINDPSGGVMLDMSAVQNRVKESDKKALGPHGRQMERRNSRIMHRYGTRLKIRETVDLEYKRVLGGTYVQESGKSDDGGTHRTMLTYQRGEKSATGSGGLILMV